MVLKELDPRVLVVDSLALRGLGIMGLLRQWAQERGVELDFLDPTVPFDAYPTAYTYRLAVLSLGHVSISNSVASGWLDDLRRVHADTPVAVWSDLPASSEALSALRQGVQGFVPTMTTPQLAMQALTFIMSGGTYFPPEALIGLPIPGKRRQSKGVGRSKPDGPNGHGGSWDGNKPREIPDAFGREGEGRRPRLAAKRHGGRSNPRGERMSAGRFSHLSTGRLSSTAPRAPIDGRRGSIVA